MKPWAIRRPDFRNEELGVVAPARNSARPGPISVSTMPTGRSARGSILVADDEEATGRLTRRHFPGWTVTQAFTLEDAAAQLDRIADLGLVLLDLNLADTVYPEPIAGNPFQGSFELARRIRQSRPRLPVIIYTAHVNAAIANATHLANAGLVSKQDAGENLDLLYRRLDLAYQSGGSQAAPYVAWLREHRGVTRREADVLALAVQGITRYSDIGEHLGISPNTVKRHVTSLLDRAGADSLFELVWRARTIHD
jgi:DNA-binding NarL/FixJ family response regulator